MNLGNDLNANEKKIINLADPEDLGDAVSLGYLEETSLKRTHGVFIGDDVTTNFTFSHNFGTKLVSVILYIEETGVSIEDDTYAVTRTTNNAISVTFVVAPAQGTSVRVVVLG